MELNSDNLSDFVKNVEILKNGETIKFSIQAIPKDRYDEATDHMCKFFIADEPVFESENVKNDPVAMNEMRNIFSKVLNDNLSLGAFFNNPNGEKSILAGMNVLYIGGKNGKNYFGESFKSEKIKKIMDILNILSENIDTKKLYDSDNYIGGFGLSVEPTYRGNAIGYHLLMARNEFGKRLNIFSSVTIFTSSASIKLAYRAGFEVLLEKRNDELIDENKQLLIPTCKTTIFKTMGKKLI